MEDSRTPKQAYKMMISMDENERKCWVTEVKKCVKQERILLPFFLDAVASLRSVLRLFSYPFSAEKMFAAPKGVKRKLSIRK